MKYIKTFESFYIGCWMILDGHHRLLKDINNGIVNNGPDMIIKTPPAPTTKQPPSIIKNSDIVYRPLNLVNKIADSEKCIKEFNRKRSLKKTT